MRNENSQFLSCLIKSKLFNIKFKTIHGLLGIYCCPLLGRSYPPPFIKVQCTLIQVIIVLLLVIRPPGLETLIWNLM